MDGALELVKKYMGFILGLTGMSFTQLLNLQPSYQSVPEFVVFVISAVVLEALCLTILCKRKLVRRPRGTAREHVYSRGARLAAGIAVVLIPAVALPLVLLFHIPNTRPIVVQAGAEDRRTNKWMRVVPFHRLEAMNLGDEVNKKVGVLFAPDKRSFVESPAIHRITISNRSTASSPPLELRMSFEPPGVPAVWAAAVASNAVHPWMPFGNVLGHSRPFCEWLRSGGLFQRGHIFGCSPKEAEWLSYERECPASLDHVWCFDHPPRDREGWPTPTLRLPPIPARGNQEIYFELAFDLAHSVGVHQTVPATLELQGVPKLQGEAQGESFWNGRWSVDL